MPGEALANVPKAGKTVTIVIPVYNEEKTLNQSLIAIRKQRVQGIVIVLDRCYDDSGEVC